MMCVYDVLGHVLSLALDMVRAVFSPVMLAESSTLSIHHTPADSNYSYLLNRTSTLDNGKRKGYLIKNLTLTKQSRSTNDAPIRFSLATTAFKVDSALGEVLS